MQLLDGNLFCLSPEKMSSGQTKYQKEMPYSREKSSKKKYFSFYYIDMIPVWWWWCSFIFFFNTPRTKEVFFFFCTWEKRAIQEGNQLFTFSFSSTRTGAAVPQTNTNICLHYFSFQLHHHFILPMVSVGFFSSIEILTPLLLIQ